MANSRWFEDVVGRHIAAAVATLPAEAAAAQERGRTKNPWAAAEDPPLIPYADDLANTGISHVSGPKTPQMADASGEFCVYHDC